MKKLIKSHKGRKKIDFLIVSALILALLAISPTAASVNESFGPLKYIGENIDIAYVLAGIGAAILFGFIYIRLNRGENEFITNLRKTLYSFKIRKITENKEAVQENVDSEGTAPEKAIHKEIIQEKIASEAAVPEMVVLLEVTAKQLKLYIAVPILFIAIAELLIFSGKLEIAIWVHIGVLLALSLSSIFTKDPRVHKIHMPLMLLPILRLVNLSMPIFSQMTLYTFILYYTPLAIPIAAIMFHQRNSLNEIGITSKHLLPYIVLAVPLSFLLGLGEYLIIRPGFLIPDLSFKNLLMLTVIMVFFVGLVEEMIFRSLLQNRLEQALSLPEALLITSFLFGLMHSGYGTYFEMLYTGFVGLVIGLIFYKTRSLPFIAVLHGFVNVFLFGILPLHLVGWTWL